MGEDEGRKARSSRGGANKAAKALGALSELRAAQAGGRAATFKLREEDQVYDVVGEEDYEKIVKERRGKHGDFVVDDEGLGYEEDGEEEDWQKADHYSEDEMEDNDDEPRKDRAKATKGGETAAKGQTAVKGRGKVAGSAAAAALAAAAPEVERGRISKMFQNARAAEAAAGTAGAKRKADAAPAVEDTDALLNDILGDIGEEPAPKTERRMTTSHSKRSRAPIAVASLKPTPAPRKQRVTFGASDVHEIPARLSDPEENAIENDVPEMEMLDADNQPRDGVVQDPAVVLKSEEDTPAQVETKFEEEEEPEELAATAGWQSFCNGEEVVEDGNVTEEAKAQAAVMALSKDDGTLPLDADGTLPFYFMDALEEPGSPGSVFLFGKVPAGKDGGMTSCCAIVKGLDRCLYVVPKPGTFDEEDEEINALEAAAAADASVENKIALMKALHSRSTSLKAEIRSLLMKHDVKAFRLAPVKRSYAFEREDIPRRPQWVFKIRYSASLPMLPSDVRGETFLAILGTQTTCIENLMIKRRMMGPSWLALQGAARVPTSECVSWCKLEVNIQGKKAVGHPDVKAKSRDPPPLIVAALNLKTHIDPKKNVSEVAAASVMYLHGVKSDGPMAPEQWNTMNTLRHFSAVRRLDGMPFPPGFAEEAAKKNASPDGRRNGGVVLSVQSSERGLLSFLLAKLQQIDPDVIVGHNVCGYDLDVLLHRLSALKVPNWSRLGRLKRSKMPNLSGGGNSFGGGASHGVLQGTSGRLLCDTYLSSRELLHEVSYSLTALAANQLKHTRVQLSPSDISKGYLSSEGLQAVVSAAETDAWLSLSLMFKLSALPLSRQLTNLSGSLWNKTLQGGRAQRTEYVLLHEFHARKFMVPDKLSFKERERIAKDSNSRGNDGEADDGEQTGKKSKKRAPPSYAGGLVLEPKKGLYDKCVLLLDFNSLYPSIIQEYNICFTTVERPQDDAVPPLPTNTAEQAILPQILRRLVERRRQVKAMLKSEKNPQKKQQLDIRQQAIKLTANSMYGCLGFANSRFFAKPLAQLVTSQGREILQSTVDLVEQNLSLEVIYGDTDSVMVYTGSDDMLKIKAIANTIKTEVNKRYRLLELELDGIFKSMLLLKKKKYAAMKIEVMPDGSTGTVLETKGLDIVRRDWCPLSKEAGNYALGEIMSGKGQEESIEAVHEKLREIRAALDAGTVPLEKYIITKQLTRSPHEYPDARNQPHVQVALRRLASGKRDGVAAGETVPYVICTNSDEEMNGKKSIAERAYHPDEVRASKSIEPDKEYYLAQQIHPVVSRLCSPIEGTSSSHLADCLGLDPSRFASSSTANTNREEALLGGSLEDESRFSTCSPLMLKCPGCAEAFEFRGAQAIATGAVPAEKLLACPRDDCKTVLTAGQLVNQLRLSTWAEISKYYDGLLKCDEETCDVETRNISARAVGDHAQAGSCCPNFPKCTGRVSPVVTERHLYTQLVYFSRLVDASRFSKDREQKMRLAPVKETLDYASEIIDKICSRSAYRWVNLAQVCAPATTRIANKATTRYA